MAEQIPTRFLILSDTHGDRLHKMPEGGPVDVLIHCGDMTEESKMAEFRATIGQLREFDAPLKLVVAGNHDFTLDAPTFRKKLAGVRDDMELVGREYGDFGAARALFETAEAKAAGIVFLDEGRHRFELANGASLGVFASPYTPSVDEWAFQYDPHEGHDWRRIPDGVDVVVTHGPPKGIMDHLGDQRARIGDAGLFARIARVRPKMHCFGHAHRGWGAKRVVWRERVSDAPSHLVDILGIDGFESLRTIETPVSETPEITREEVVRAEEFRRKGYCSLRPPRDELGSKTVFVNAAIQGEDEDSQHLPWIVELGLSRGS